MRKIISLLTLSLGMWTPSLTLEGIPWIGGGDGDWDNIGNWPILGIPSPSDDVNIGQGILGNVQVRINALGSVGNLTIETGQSLKINNNGQLAIYGTQFLNDGELLINSSASSTHFLTNVANLNIQGTGQITMSASSQNWIYGNTSTNTLTNDGNHTIQGSGQLGLNSLIFINHGLVQATNTTPLKIDVTDSTSLTNTGILQATGGGILELSDDKIENLNGQILAQNASRVKLFGTQINQGTLGTLGTGIIENTGDSILKDVKISNTFNNENGHTVFLQDSLQLNGTWYNNSAGSSTDIVVDSTNLSLLGNGTFRLSNASHNRITASTVGNTLLIGSDITIAGSGIVGNDKLNILNEGAIVADQSTSMNLSVHTNLINEGTLKATNGGTLHLSDSTIDNELGLILAEDASKVTFSNLTINGGLLQTSDSGILEVAGTTLLDATTVDGALNVPNGRTLYLIDSLSLTGTLSLNSVGSTTSLVIYSASVSLNGGKTLLSNASHNSIYGSSETNQLIISSDHTIEGSGRLGNNQLNIINQGLILANNSTSLIIDPFTPGLVNESIIKANNGAFLTLNPGDYNNSDGSFIADNGTIQLSGATISGGTLQTLNGGLFSVAASSTLDNVHLMGDLEQLNARTVVLKNGFTLDGSYKLNSVGSYTHLIFDTDSFLLTGNGELDLSSSTFNRLYASDDNYTTTFDQNIIISGSGNIGDDSMGIINKGLIQAGPGDNLSIDPSEETFVNESIVKAHHGGQITLQDGIFENSLGIIQAENASVISMTSTTVQGGNLRAVDSDSVINFAGNNTLDGVTLEGNSIIPNGHSLSIENSLVNHGNLMVNSVGSNTNLVIQSSKVSLSGNGVISLGASTNSKILSSSPGNRLVNEINHTIRGTGRIGVNDLLLTNEGNIIVEDGDAMIIDLANSETFTNDGFISISEDSTITFQDSFANSGLLLFASGGHLFGHGNLTFNESSLLGIEIGNLTPISIGLLGDWNLEGNLIFSLDPEFINLLDDSTLLTLGSASNINGQFENILNGERLFSIENMGSFQVNYGNDSAFASNALILSDFEPIPEPETWALIIIGGILTGLFFRRRFATTKQ